MDDELENEAIEAAEGRPAGHDHDDVSADNMVDHLRAGHGLDAPEDLNPATLHGLHDRLHHEADAVDDRDGAD